MTAGYDHAGPVRWALIFAAALLTAAPAAGAEDDTPDAAYLHDDAIVSARQMYTFKVGEERISVLLGDFSLTVGRRLLSGRDAVMWIHERRHGPTVFRKIEVYVETNAKLVEADGTVDQTVSEEIPDPDNPDAKRRVIIARGNVYVAQGHPDSDRFLEMTAHAAVAYSVPDKTVAGPLSERIVGVYLEGDVLLRRGEQTIRADRLFYDFDAGRALAVRPVLRTIQRQRNIPIYIRAKEGRQLAAREDESTGLRIRGYEWRFTDATITTSDFKVPAWSLVARRAHMTDTTIYAPDGTRLSERAWRTELSSVALKLGHIPVLWSPYVVGDGEEGHTALRKLQVGRHGRYGWGLESDWFLFRLLGIPRPEGFSGRLESDWYERGFLVGPTVEYRRESFSGYARGHIFNDGRQKDDFGTQRRNIPAQRDRGWLLWRHKQFLPRHWQVQAELSYMCDRNFLEEFFPGEFWAGKEQETLIYGKKQQDDWAVTFLTKHHINEFVLGNTRIGSVIAETESLPEVAAYVVGKSILDDRLGYYGQARLGVVRFRPDPSQAISSSESVGRADLRQEINAPIALGPVKVLPYVSGRGTYWSQTPNDGGLLRGWMQVGVGTSMDIWRIHEDVDSKFWDLHRIKHVITPYGAMFGSETNVDDLSRLKPFTSGVETLVQGMGGAVVGVRQLWQTKRGPKGNRQTVDWLRLDISAATFSEAETTLPADGRFLSSRPEYSFPQNAVNAKLAWSASDSTTLLADVNYDMDTAQIGRAHVGMAIDRRPRLSYFLGVRYIKLLDSSIGSAGLNYKISRKYAFRVFEQYDFDWRGGLNQVTAASISRKFSRSYIAMTISYDRTYDDVTVMFTFWPEGIREASLGGKRMNYLSTYGGQRQRDRERERDR